MKEINERDSELGIVDVAFTQRTLAVKHRLAEYENDIYVFRSDPASHFVIGWSPDTSSG